VFRLAANQKRHPLQFGREVVATVLGAPELSDWKLCMPKAIPGGPTVPQLEEEMANNFKAVFKEFEPKLDDD